MALHNNRSTYVKRNNRDFLYFGGTNYLGIAHRQELLDAASMAFLDYGFSSGASRLTSGENEILLSLERAFAEFANAEASLVLPAGYMSNQAVVEGLDAEVDAWVLPKIAHSSIKSALHQTRKPVIVAEWLDSSENSSWRDRHELGIYRSIGIFSEPIDALTGKIKEINNLVNQASKRDYVILDEAQSIGVLGETGRGALQYFSLKPGSNLIRTGTFSKAIGAYGGFVLASKELIDLIKERSSCFKGSTSLPPLVCAATRASLRLIDNDASTTLMQLRQNIAHLNQLLRDCQFGPCLNNSNIQSSTPIYYMPYVKGMERVFDTLPKRNIYIPSMSNYFPGVSEIGLRWTIQSGHRSDELNILVQVFKDCFVRP